MILLNMGHGGLFLFSEGSAGGVLVNGQGAFPLKEPPAFDTVVGDNAHPLTRRVAMKIRECLSPQHIYVGHDLPTKDAVLRFVASQAAASGLTGDEGVLLSGFHEREASFTTGIGQGIALPHATSPRCDKTTLFLLSLGHPIDFDSIDDQPVDVILALVIPQTNPSEHLQILARTARLCKQAEFPRALRDAVDAEGLWETIRRFEEDAELAWYGGEV